MPTTRITLEYPVTHNGETITELSLRRPRVADNLAADKSGGTNAEREIRLIANLAEAAPEVIHLLDLKDYATVTKAFSDFLS